MIPDDYYSQVTNFVSADVENQVKVTPNAMVADDALME